MCGAKSQPAVSGRGRDHSPHMCIHTHVHTHTRMTLRGRPQTQGLEHQGGPSTGPEGTWAPWFPRNPEPACVPDTLSLPALWVPPLTAAGSLAAGASWCMPESQVEQWEPLAPPAEGILTESFYKAASSSQTATLPRPRATPRPRVWPGQTWSHSPLSPRYSSASHWCLSPPACCQETPRVVTLPPSNPPAK